MLAFYFIQYHYRNLENALKEKEGISINQLTISSEYAIKNDLGTGLGLSICKNITERLNGTFGVCSQFNAGSTFWFNLPISIDLILLDLQMPYFTGLELIKLIKQPDSVNKDYPVIAITAHPQSQQRKILIDAGFDECLIKPVLL